MRRTFCFTDIEGSTRLLGRLGADAYEAVQDTQRAILRRAWAAHGGVEVRSEGDGSFVTFEDPVAAIAACLQAQLDLRAERWPAGANVRVRMGLHTGEANQTGLDFVGLAVHHAARVGDAANGGQVLVSSHTADEARALPEFAALIDLGTFRLRDVDEPMRMFAIEHPDLPADPRPPRAPSGTVHNLPIVRTAFVGRDDELREVLKLIAGQPMVTILGAGGVGKTRLALEAASASTGSFVDGAWLVELAAITDPNLVASRVATALGLQDDPTGTPTDAILAHLRDRKTLLVLDNCEHLLDPVADLVDAALRVAAGLTVVATSREPLRIRGETTWRLPSFSDDEAIELFADRALIAEPSFVLDEDSKDIVAQICQRLDGIALAIELAASRLRAVSLKDLAASLDDRFTSLVGGYRTDLPRHQTLRAAIDWSYELLDPTEQNLFASLSVFRGGATTEAIVAVCGDDIGTLGSLVDRSLVVPADDRYTMLETIREYATEKLEASGRADDVRQAHRDHFSRDGTLEQLFSDQDNLRAALAFRTDEQMLRLAAVSSPIWFRYGPYEEGMRWLRTALEANPEPSEARAAALGAFTTMLPSVGAYEEAAAAWAEILDWHRSRDDTEEIAQALYGRAELALTQGDLGSAKVDLDEALSCELEDSRDIDARCNFALAHIALVEVRTVDAITHAQAAVALFRELEAKNYEAAGIMMLARVESAAGNLEDAHDHYEKALEIHHLLRDRANVAYTSWHFGSLQVSMGKTARGIVTLRESLELSEEVGDAHAPVVQATLGRALFVDGDREEGRRLLDDAIAKMESIQHPYGTPYGYAFRADLALIEGDPSRAIADALHAAEGLLTIGDTGGLCSAVLRLAAAEAQRGDHVRAARLYGAVIAAVGDITPLEVIVGQPYDTVALCREALGDSAFDAATSEGGAMTLSEALELARG